MDGMTSVGARALPASTTDAEAAWYVVCAKMRREKFAALELARRGVEIFLPRLALAHRRDVLVRPLFPGYLFAHLRLPDDARRVVWTPGVRRLD